MSITPYIGQIAFNGNHYSDGGEIQFYAQAFGVVAAENKFERAYSDMWFFWPLIVFALESDTVGTAAEGPYSPEQVRVDCLLGHVVTLGSTRTSGTPSSITKY